MNKKTIAAIAAIATLTFWRSVNLTGNQTEVVEQRRRHGFGAVSI